MNPPENQIGPGPKNSITDVAGLHVGNAEDPVVRSGTTVVLCEGLRAIAAVDIRGGGPGTRETDALASDRLVRSVDAIVLSGGSAFGLEAAGGVHAWLATRGRGFDVGEQIVPIVPGAILYDLANGGDKEWGLTPPYRELGIRAAQSAGQDFSQGKAGAGYGAMAGSYEGGLGSASVKDPGTGVTIGALVAVNSFGEAVTPGGHFYAAPHEMNSEFGDLGPCTEPAPIEPTFPKLSHFNKNPALQNTTIAVVACDADLEHGDVQRLAGMAQAGMARAIRPVFTPFDGDSIFTLATGKVKVPDTVGLARIGALGADCLARAIARAVYQAHSLEKGRTAWSDRHRLK